MTASAPTAALAPRQLAIAAAFGLAVWLIAALAIRLTFPLGIWQAGPPLALLYAATIPASYPMLPALDRAAGLAPAQRLAGLAVATVAALFADGIALVWIPSLYGPSGADLGPAAAWLLWAAASLFLVALWRQR